jgi:L-alanine-DL-glutamate epimerase-like enolase superfamily enzyme
MRLTYTKYQLPFQHPFRISKGLKTHQSTLIVALEHFGRVGYGEATAISYYDVTVESMVEALEKKRLFIEKFAFTDPERFWHFLHHLLPTSPFLVCALDMAGWDLFGKMRAKPLMQHWGLDRNQAPVTDFTIGIDTPEKMVAKLLENPWPVYKIKVGFEGDIDVIKTLRTHTDAPFRVDANAAWDVQTAIQKIRELQELGVELIEQPLAKDDWDGMKLLYHESSIPLIADESCVTEQDVARCVGHFHGINIKLTKCSGITPARRMIEHARKLGLQIMLGCMNESTVGTAALAQLAPLADYLDADGTLLQTEQVGEGVDFIFGKIQRSDKPGLGVTIRNN